ncbi:MAG: rhomboid family intramembrane serine protease [Planctomycetes bacterium]|nr:rhomboid family intramembrane serine protease [Planctomycetota bacterium]
MTELNAPEEVYPDNEPDEEPANPEPQAFARRLFRATPRAYVTKILIAANVVVFGLMVLRGVNIMAPTIEGLIKWGANFGPRTTDGQWWRLLSCVFVHIGILHIGVNMWALRNVGGLVERLYGNGFFLLCYLASGLIASLASVCWNPMIVSAGASGAIFGIVGSLLAYFLRQRGSIPAAMLQSIRNSTLVFVAINLFYGFAHTGIDNAAHIGGLGSGFVLGLVLARPLDLEARRRHVLPRVAAGVVVTLGMACASLPFLPMYVAKWEKAVTWYGSEEKQALESCKRLVQRAQGGSMTDEALADGLEKQCLPRFKKMAERMAEVKVPRGTRFAEVHQLLSDVAVLRRDALVAFIEGLRAKDMSKIERYRTAWGRAERRIQEFNNRHR